MNISTNQTPTQYPPFLKTSATLSAQAFIISPFVSMAIKKTKFPLWAGGALVTTLAVSHLWKKWDKIKHEKINSFLPRINHSS